MEIKISKKPVKYEEAIEYLDERVHQVSQDRNKELIWFLEHKSVYTCGVNFNKKDVLDKNVKIVKTNRGGKITWHGPGQLICYFVIDISRRKKDIRVGQSNRADPIGLSALISLKKLESFVLLFIVIFCFNRRLLL